jgi:transposase
MAHVRRKFVELLKSLPKEKRSDHSATEIVHQIGKLYLVEELLRANPGEDFARHRAEVRLRDSLPLFGELESLISKAITGQSEVSPFGAALKYAENELPKIKLYLKNGACEIDNNWIENMIRPFALQWHSVSVITYC